ncbi:hypothetical protein AC578_2191 [Pseudocercospora eumusae]|uniref:Uncharacterized protein n=1 Tax=Pseudocercospora eumusae TaxID=321146 RepID=A0A139GYM6_9PEZI|nr:hypothetical protein AC578_2191 [Pseudocercospora eumusae]
MPSSRTLPPPNPHHAALSPDDRLQHLLQADAMRNYHRVQRRQLHHFNSLTMLLLLAFAALALIGLWHAQGTRETPPTTHQPQNTSASCAQLCTSFDLLSLVAPAHPHILWLTSRAADYAPDWLHALPHGWPLNSLGRTSSVVPTIWRTNPLADQVRDEATYFVRLGLMELLDRCVESFQSLTHERQTQSFLQHYLSRYTLLPAPAVPDERETLRAAMAWANDTAAIDQLVRLRDAVSSGLSELRTTIAHGVAHIDQSIALGHGPWDYSCDNATQCKREWQHELDHLRLLTSWTYFVELNLLTSSHTIDAMAFFTRYFKRLHYIGHRAGLYAARQWALDHVQTSEKMVKACGTCFADTSAWHSWWQPYENTIPSTPPNVLEPHDPILLRTRFHGKSKTGRGEEDDGYGGHPIIAPLDFRKYKPALNGEQCLGIDHIWDDEQLDRELEAKVKPPPGYPYSIDSHELRVGLEFMWGNVWCIKQARMVHNRKLGLLEPAEAYALRWVKDWPRRWQRRTFVHEAWDAE